MKCTAIIKHVTGKRGEEEILEYIQNNPFSVLIDETTDISVTKELALVV